MKPKITLALGWALLTVSLVCCHSSDPFTLTYCVVTGNTSGITSTNATVTGTIACDGGYVITERGVYWGTSSNPETTGTKLQIGSGTGSFTSVLTCLNPNTTYYVKAYAVNNKGTFIGCEVTFTTLPVETFVDIRDGQVYKTVKIGNQTWMAENLNYDIPDNSFCYDLTPANCDADGKLYYYESALQAVPAGWHLPSRSEFETLFANFSSPEEAYDQLIVGGCSGFNSKFPGILNHTGLDFFGIGVYADYWTTTEEEGTGWVWIIDLNTSDQRTLIGADRKNRGFSVRCVKDESSPTP